ncbi:Uncharacterised protein [Roseomonas gilardii subsp. rosea]|nr:Uncharacterised protein [Roseomonas gilardii subsp. rosea]
MDWAENQIRDAISDNAWPWLPTLTQCLRWLPAVNARQAKAWLSAMRDQCQGHAALPDQYPAPEVGLEAIEELFHEDSYENPRVSPAGARLLLGLYEADRLPKAARKPQKAVADLEALQRHAAADAELRAKAIAHLDGMAEQRRLREAARADPAALTSDRFTMGTLDEVFFAHAGKGAKTLMVGGVEVRKTISGPYFSNSGKSPPDFHVAYSWVDPASGEERTVERGSRYEGNRRNDDDRNWGLGPE